MTKHRERLAVRIQIIGVYLFGCAFIPALLGLVAAFVGLFVRFNSDVVIVAGFIITGVLCAMGIALFVVGRAAERKAGGRVNRWPRRSRRGWGHDR